MKDIDKIQQDILESLSYYLPEIDTESLHQRNLRPIWLQLKLLRPEIIVIRNEHLG